MASSWTGKLEKRLGNLTDTASKESILTLAKWVGFNRKHAAAFCPGFLNALKKSKSRRWLIWQILHEIILLDRSNDAKWEKLLDLRVVVGEQVVVPELERGEMDDLLLDKVKPLVNEWDDVTAFGGPLLIQQILRLVRNPPPPKKPTANIPNLPDETIAPTTVPTDAKKADTVSTSDKKEEKLIEKLVTGPSSKVVTTPKPEPTQRRRSSVSVADVQFDFEAEGVPEGKVDAKEFLEPCKAIATLQIARDLRSDAAAHLSSVLSSIPSALKRECGEYNDEEEEVPDEVAERLGAQLDDSVLDLDLGDELKSVDTFRELIQKQSKARKRLIFLLIKSRCRFGSDQAAGQYYDTEKSLKKLEQRRDLLSDAMDLEGIDAEQEAGGTENTKDEKELPPLSWYNRDEPPAKRTKVQ